MFVSKPKPYKTNLMYPWRKHWKTELNVTVNLDNLFIVKHNLLPVNTTIILIIIVLVLIHN